MIKQKFFNYKFENQDDYFNFYTNETNIIAYDNIIKKNDKNLFLIGPRKSGKTLLSKIWLKKNQGIKLNNNLEKILYNNKNVLIEDLDKICNEENLFHILNHCKNYNLKILITSNLEMNDINLSLKDLISRLKTFNVLKIYNPDDDMLLNILTKLFTEKQFIINSNEVFQYIIKNANRSYEEMFSIVSKLDSLSLEKKRQLTIPLIKEIL